MNNIYLTPLCILYPNKFIKKTLNNAIEQNQLIIGRQLSTTVN